MKSRNMLWTAMLLVFVCGCTALTGNPTNSLPPLLYSPSPSLELEPPPIQLRPSPTPASVLNPLLPQRQVVVKMRNGLSCVLALGITRTEATDLMVEAGVPYSPLAIDLPELSMPETLRQFLSNGRSEATEYELWYSAPSEGNILKSITVYSNLLTTDLGLRVGDSRDRVIELYGTPHNLVPSHDTYMNYEYFTGNYKFTVSLHDDVVTDWGAEINTPETRLSLIASDGTQVYLYLGIPSLDAIQRLSKAEIHFENPDGTEKRGNTSHWRLDVGGIDLDFGEPEQRPIPSTSKISNFSLYGYTVNTPAYPTGKGLAVGDTEKKLLNIYGPAREVKEQNGVYKYCYLVDEGRYLAGDTELVFTVKSGKIVNWRICNPWQIEFDASN